MGGTVRTSREIEDQIYEVVKAGVDNTRDICVHLNLSRSSVYRGLRQLAEDDRITKTVANGKYYWQLATSSRKLSKPAPSTPTIEKQQATNHMEQLYESIQWLFGYVDQLESENQSLYKALSCYSEKATTIRKRYEDRLEAYIAKQKEE